MLSVLTLLSGNVSEWEALVGQVLRRLHACVRIAYEGVYADDDDDEGAKQLHQVRLLCNASPSHIG